MPAKRRSSAIVDPHQKRLRALLMLRHRIQHGATIKEIAEAFNVSEHTVQRTMSYAKKAQLVVEQEDKIFLELVPAAHNAIKRGLDDTDHPIEAAELGIKVFQHTIPAFQKTDKGIPVDSSDELSRYITEYRSGEGVIDGHTASVGAVEGEPVLALPSAAPSAPAEGLDEPHRGDAAGHLDAESSAESVGLEFIQGTSVDVESKE